ncbi:unnamed protein product [Amoebophrya sp. A25]|nr:unnamed protein product [Amoebophrya sp. A25]|eukprot:GSA25T00020781001.1
MNKRRSLGPRGQACPCVSGRLWGACQAVRFCRCLPFGVLLSPPSDSKNGIGWSPFPLCSCCCCVFDALLQNRIEKLRNTPRLRQEAPPSRGWHFSKVVSRRRN